MSSIGARIKIKRKQSRMTQIELSKLVSVSSQVISNWERDYSDPNHSDVVKLSLALNCPTDYLHGISDENLLKESLIVEGEFRIFEELKMYPVMLHDLASDPEGKVEELFKLWKKAKKESLDKDV